MNALLDVLKEIFRDERLFSTFRMMLRHANDLVSVDDVASHLAIKKVEARRCLEQLSNLGVVERRNGSYMLSLEHDAVRYLIQLEDVLYTVDDEMKDKVSKLVEMLKGIDICSILLHHNADPDAVGSGIALALAMKSLGVDARVIAPLGMSAQSKKLLQAYPYPVDERAENLSDIVVVVDTGSSAQLPAGVLEGREVIVVDHHTPADITKKARIAFVDESARATAIVVYRILKALGIKVTREMATYLVAGIIADTGFLRMARNEEIIVLFFLLEKGVDLQQMMNILHVEKDYSERVAVLKGVRRAELYSVGDVLLAITEIGSYEASVALTLLRLGADVGIAANIQRDEIRISCRVRNSIAEQLNLLEVFKKLEGLLSGKSGGHITAISFNGRAPENWDEAKKTIVKAISKKLGKKVKKI